MEKNVCFPYASFVFIKATLNAFFLSHSLYIDVLISHRIEKNMFIVLFSFEWKLAASVFVENFEGCF